MTHADRIPSHPSLATPLADRLAAFEALVRRTAARHSLTDGDLEEVLQEVRIRLWKATAERGVTGEISGGYIYRTAVSATIDLLRRRRARREARLSDPSIQPPARQSRPDTTLEFLELQDQVSQALADLAPARQAAVRMHLAGYPREEIAATLGWSEAKTRNLLYRGLADLREMLRQRGVRPEGA